MIKNERQYRISKSRLEKFVEDFQQLKEHHDPMAAVHRAAYESQIEELNFEIAEYRALAEGHVSVFSVGSLAELPVSLIRARIARGKTHKDLAIALGVKEQQVQRWESENYEGASLATLKTIADALELNVSVELLVINTARDVPKLLECLDESGYDKNLLGRVLPSDSYEALVKGVSSAKDLWNALLELSALFGVSIRRLFERPLLTGSALLSGVKHKLSAKANSKRVEAFTVYAHYIAALSCKASSRQNTIAIPQRWEDFRATLVARSSRISLETTIDYLWSCGIAVIPLCCSGAFHGAVWRMAGRYIIILKQTNEQTARWLFDLLHEVGHIANRHVSESSAIVELEPIGLKDSDVDDDETVANEWAEDVLFNGQSDEIEKEVEAASFGRLPMMKGAIEKVAEARGIERGVLANHMAWRLSKQKLSWWGAAENLQKADTSPFALLRERVIKHLDLSVLSEIDREMFLHAMTQN